MLRTVGAAQRYQTCTRRCTARDCKGSASMGRHPAALAELARRFQELCVAALPGQLRCRAAQHALVEARWRTLEQSGCVYLPACMLPDVCRFAAPLALSSCISLMHLWQLVAQTLCTTGALQIVRTRGCHASRCSGRQVLRAVCRPICRHPTASAVMASVWAGASGGSTVSALAGDNAPQRRDTHRRGRDFLFGRRTAVGWPWVHPAGALDS